MSAELLRRAAALMRERAEAAEGMASESPWAASGMWWYPVLEIAEDGRAVERSHGFHAVCDAHGSGHVAHSATIPAAEHIASWHPAVALAVADWLEREARIDECAREYGKHGISPEHPAVAVARAYLGVES